MEGWGGTCKARCGNPNRVLLGRCQSAVMVCGAVRRIMCVLSQSRSLKVPGV